jgi:hypothetical protein
MSISGAISAANVALKVRVAQEPSNSIFNFKRITTAKWDQKSAAEKLKDLRSLLQLDPIDFSQQLSQTAKLPLPEPSEAPNGELSKPVYRDPTGTSQKLLNEPDAQNKTKVSFPFELLDLA